MAIARLTNQVHVRLSTNLYPDPYPLHPYLHTPGAWQTLDHHKAGILTSKWKISEHLLLYCTYTDNIYYL